MVLSNDLLYYFFKIRNNIGKFLDDYCICIQQLFNSLLEVSVTLHSKWKRRAAV